MSGIQIYETAVATAREQLARGAALSRIMSSEVDRATLELFLISFSALGVSMTEPVEGWIRRAGERCQAVGLVDLGRNLVKHAVHEAGHHHLMIDDTRKLVARWNARHAAALDAQKLLAAPRPPGVEQYRTLHEDVIAGPAPFAQLAIEYEIEMLSVRHGGPLIKQCVARLGAEIVEGLSFIEEHVAVDEGHTRFNANELDRLLAREPSYLEPLVQAGSAALGAYGAFLEDCLRQADALKPA